MALEDNIEYSNVKKVYENIANHFNDTRKNVWPNVSKFILSLDKYSYMLDVGCGNGKNSVFAKKNNIICETCDLTERFCDIVYNEKDISSICCNIIKLPYKSNCFDSVLNIAVLHHISSFERRLECVNEFLRVLKIGGRMMIQVWAYENNERVDKVGVSINDNCDFLVKWSDKYSGKLFQRFYHLFRREEVERLLDSIAEYNVEIEYISWEKSNWIFVVNKIG